MSMSDLAVHHGNPASLIAEWRWRASSVNVTPSEERGYLRAADELEAVLEGFALVPADDPALDRVTEQSKAHHAERGRYLTVTESLDLETEGAPAETSPGPIHVIDESGRPYGYEPPHGYDHVDPVHRSHRG